MTVFPPQSREIFAGHYPEKPHRLAHALGHHPLLELGAQAQLAEAHALGLKVIPWTVNESERIDRLIGWGVDGLISDHPLRVREVMVHRGLALPAPVSVPAPPRGARPPTAAAPSSTTAVSCCCGSRAWPAWPPARC